MRVFLLLFIICSFAPFVKAQEVEIIQRISKQQPILFIDADNKKVVRVKFPLCIKLNNKANVQVGEFFSRLHFTAIVKRKL